MRCSYPNSVFFKSLKRGYRRGFAILQYKSGKMPYQIEKDVYFVRLCPIQFSWVVYINNKDKLGSAKRYIEST